MWTSLGTCDTVFRSNDVTFKRRRLQPCTHSPAHVIITCWTMHLWTYVLWAASRLMSLTGLAPTMWAALLFSLSRTSRAKRLLGKSVCLCVFVCVQVTSAGVVIYADVTLPSDSGQTLAHEYTEYACVRYWNTKIEVEFYLASSVTSSCITVISLFLYCLLEAYSILYFDFKDVCLPQHIWLWRWLHLLNDSLLDVASYKGTLFSLMVFLACFVCMINHRWTICQLCPQQHNHFLYSIPMSTH